MKINEGENAELSKCQHFSFCSITVQNGVLPFLNAKELLSFLTKPL